ncbi:hypothetical protein I7I53_06589 [Histoplasma capsulatum var. duboisii H88]|uniref:Uncharacterized protein n=1 Tax=Ajellomyces capsulatus (strain H88) TaxID=544711 RepID=A0A8A1LCG8_AJEC8|nr:hypothetical protein I7I53_06589 [Histoplasma capsulatum var. duboisii H88]
MQWANMLKDLLQSHLQICLLLSPRNSMTQVWPQHKVDVKWLTGTEVPFTGDVYELNLQDIRDIIESGQISGVIWLTDTYGVNTTSFVTIPVSNELTDRLILHHPLATWD